MEAERCPNHLHLASQAGISGRRRSWRCSSSMASQPSSGASARGGC